MHLPPHDRADAPSPPPLDTAAYALLPVPVAWCDADGRWRGCNHAFERFTGCRPGPDGVPPLPGELATGPGGLQRLVCGDADADGLAWCGVHGHTGPAEAAGNAPRLAGHLSLRRQGLWRVLTLLPEAPAPAARLAGAGRGGAAARSGRPRR